MPATLRCRQGFKQMLRKRATAEDQITILLRILGQGGMLRRAFRTQFQHIA
jgi:hypothetical protein